MAGFTAAAALLGLVALVYGVVYGVSWLAGVARSAGATGRLGGPLADRLIERGHRVCAPPRDPGAAPADRLMHTAAEDAAAGRLDPGDAAGLTAILLAAFTPQAGE